MLMRLKVIVLSNAAIHLSKQSCVLHGGLTRLEIVLCASSIPFDEIDNPREKDRSTLVYRQKVNWGQLFVIVIQDPKNSSNEIRFDLPWIHKDKLKLESH